MDRRPVQHLATGFGDEARGIARKLLTEDVIGVEDIPGIPARLDDGRALGFREHVGIERPLDGVGRALRPGQIRGRGRRGDEHLVLLACDTVHRQRNRGVRQVEQHVHAARIAPLSGDRGADIGLVLVIGKNHVHGEAVIAEFLHRLPRRGHRSRSPDVTERARLIVQHADADGLAGLRPRRPGRKGKAQSRSLLSRAGCVW